MPFDLDDAPIPPHFDDAAAATLETAIQRLADDLDRIAGLLDTIDGNLGSWDGHGKVAAQADIHADQDQLRTVIRQLRADGQDLAEQRQLFAKKQAAYLEDVQRYQDAAAARRKGVGP